MNYKILLLWPIYRKYIFEKYYFLSLKYTQLKLITVMAHCSVIIWESGTPPQGNFRFN